MHSASPLILASRSPRRAELLRSVGYRFLIRPSRTDERILAGESGTSAARRLAVAKAMDIALTVRRGTVLAADTLVLVGPDALGKPADVADARRMLRRLSGRTHRVVTGIAVCGPLGRGLAAARSITWVTFRKLTSKEIEWYLSTEEPMDKAGAYGIQGLASFFVTRIHGSFSNVVGLPLDLVYAMAGPPPSRRNIRS